MICMIMLLKAGYQTVFIQLYDAAGKGSASQWDNGKLLAQNWKKYIIISVKSYIAHS